MPHSQARSGSNASATSDVGSVKIPGRAFCPSRPAFAGTRCFVNNRSRHMLIVMKFGGTSVGSAERIVQAASLVTAALERGHHVAVVTSAMSGVTNTLIDAARTASTGKWDPQIRQRLLVAHKAAAEAIVSDPAGRDAVVADLDRRLDRFEKLCFGLSMVHELTPRLLDAISGIGEMLAAPLVAAAIRARGRESSSIDATELLVTTDQFGAPRASIGDSRSPVRARVCSISGSAAPNWTDVRSEE